MEFLRSFSRLRSNSVGNEPSDKFLVILVSGICGKWRLLNWKGIPVANLPGVSDARSGATPSVGRLGVGCNSFDIIQQELFGDDERSPQETSDRSP